MDKEKRLQKFEHVWQADAVAAELQAAGLECRVVGRPREYVNVVIGGHQHPVDLFVLEKDEKAAREVMKRFFRDREISLVPPEVDRVPGKDDFRAVIGYNLLCFIFPVVFNVFSLFPYFRLMRSSHSLSRKLLATAFLALGLWMSFYVLQIVLDRPEV